MSKLKISILIIAVLLLGILLPNSSAATSDLKQDAKQTLADGIYIIRSKINNKYVLDVYGAEKNNGTNVQLYEYTNVPQKKYKVTYLGNGYYSIIATHSNKSIDVKDASKSKGANVQQWEWNNTDAQKWMIKDVGNGYYSIISKCSGLYIDVYNAIAQNYQNIQMCDGNGLDAQKFKFEKVEDANKPEMPKGEKTIENGTYVVRSAINTKYVLDVYGANKNNGTNVQLYEYTDVPQKKFEITYLDNGYYKIIASHSGKSLNVKDSSKSKGANVEQWEWANNDAQQWIIKDVGNGYYSIISKCNGLYVDVYNAVAQNYQNIQMCDGNGLSAQKFKFEKIKTDPNENIPTGTKTINDGIYEIQSALNSNFVVEVKDSLLEDGTNIQLYLRKETKNQYFRITYLDNGYYSIIALHSGKSMDVKDGSKAKGANVQQKEYNSNLNEQQWIIKDVGNGYYSIVSKCNGLYVDVYNAVAANGTNIQMCDGNGLNAQKFKFNKIDIIGGDKTIESGTYIIRSAINKAFAIEVANASKDNCANVQLWKYSATLQQKFRVVYLDNGFYKITAKHSGKSLDVENASKEKGANVQQYQANGTNAQQWIIKDVGDGYYSIISKCNGLYVDIYNAIAANGTNIQMCDGNGLSAQKFIFEKIDTIEDLDTAKYPGYKEQIEKLMELHPNWNFEFLYTGLNFSDAVAGEYAVRSANLVPTSYGGEWISGTTLYDTGWYGASEKAIARFMDPRNFLNEIDVFQFQDVNDYLYGVCTLEGIQEQVNNSFLQDYAIDIDTACRNENVNPYYIIARLFQENGRKPKNGTYKMNGGDGKYYYNPFNIGATGNSKSEVYNNALARAKREGWDTMVKALQGGIYFCKKNWLENYQNTLYQNKFDIDSTNGTDLYSHQYMQNLFGAYNEAKSLQGMYSKTGKVDSDFTFIIPLYENMPKELSPEPVNNQESYIINVRTTGTYIRIRSDASTDSTILREIPNKGTVLLSVQRGINSNWHKIITTDGLIGYVSGTYLEQIDDVKTCNYTAKVKTNDGDGCFIRIGPSTNLDKIMGLSEGTHVTVIDDSTYKNINGYDWSRIMLSNGTQAFMPSKFLAK